MGISGQRGAFACRRTCYRDSVLSTVLLVIDGDGPMPMQDFKPAPKRRTAADKFKETNQAEYEARSACSGGKVQRVHNHNAVYPKLKDQLDRRNSMTKVNACTNGDHFGTNDTLGNVIIKRKTTQPKGCKNGGRKKRRMYQRKCNNCKPGSNQRKRITKRRTNRKNIIEIFNRNKIKVPRQNPVSKAGKKMCADITKLCKMAPKNTFFTDIKSKTFDMDVDGKKSRSDISNLSMSTFRSYTSTDHEPMV